MNLDYDGARMNQAWQLLYDLMLAQRARMPAIAAELELSPMQIQLLRLIEPDRPVPMGKAACGLGCDASNITGIVDRLEARGLIERRPADRDRRVKVLVITRDGARVREAILRRLAEPPEPIARLSPEDQRTLAEILGRALARPA
jgi:DNA-binding MarR family transcriptional regulator